MDKELKIAASVSGVGSAGSVTGSVTVTGSVVGSSVVGSWVVGGGSVIVGSSKSQLHMGPEQWAWLLFRSENNPNMV